MKRIIAMLTGLVFVASAGSIVSAQSERIEDPENDVFYNNRGSITSDIASKPNVDIREIAYSFQGDYLTLTMRVQGTISAGNVYYFISLKTNDGSDYSVSLMNGEGSAFVVGDSGYRSGETSISGNTLTGAIPMASSSTTVTHFSGSTMEYEGADMEIRWQDWAPDSEVPAAWLEEARRTETR